MTLAVLQEWGIYNGVIGEVAEIVFREGERPPGSLPAFVLAMFPKYCGHVFPPLARKSPRLPDRAFSRLPAPLLQVRGTARA